MKNNSIFLVIAFGITCLFANLFIASCEHVNAPDQMESPVSKAAAVQAAASGNLMANGGFENGLTGWRDLGGLAASLQSTDVHSGTKAVKIATGNGGGGYDLSPSGLTQLTVSAWTKVSVAGEAAYFGVDCFSANGTKLKHVSIGPLGFSVWTYSSAPVTVPSGSKKITVWIHHNPGTGAALFDDVSLVSGSGTPVTPTGYRGMYISLNNNHIGQDQFTGVNAGFTYILGNAAKEQTVLNFIAKQHINSLSLYDLPSILTSSSLSTALASFMGRARANGIVQIEAIAAADNASWDRIRTFHNTKAPFDGVLTEIEFWAGGSFNGFISALQYIHSLKWNPAPGGKPITVTAYLGYPTSVQVETMAPLLDRAYIHCYVTDGAQTYAYGATRFGYFAAANAKLGTHVIVQPIFSSEGQLWSAGSEHFMGEWLQANGMQAAENLFLTNWNAAAWGSALTLTGYQYYDYFFLSKYLP